MKICYLCGASKDLNDFYLRKSAKDGRQNCCKACSKRNRKEQIKRNNKNRPKLSVEENKARKKESDRRWRVNNPGKARARSRRYDRRVIQATPSWLTDEQKSQIDDIYKYCPSGYHVDHIMPLKGKDSCGLHVPWNLQYLLANDNLKKGNKVLT